MLLTGPEDTQAAWYSYPWTYRRSPCRIHPVNAGRLPISNSIRLPPLQIRPGAAAVPPSNLRTRPRNPSLTGLYQGKGGGVYSSITEPYLDTPGRRRWAPTAATTAIMTKYREIEPHIYRAICGCALNPKCSTSVPINGTISACKTITSGLALIRLRNPHSGSGSTKTLAVKPTAGFFSSRWFGRAFPAPYRVQFEPFKHISGLLTSIGPIA